MNRLPNEKGAKRICWRRGSEKNNRRRSSWTMASTGKPMEMLAITGIGCLLPGDSNDPQTLWDHLLAGHDLITPTPADRWNLDAYYHPDPAVPGRTYLRWGGF